ncbi:MAG: DinB family protein [Bacteroidia bacterium]
MNRQELIEKLYKAHNSFLDYMMSLSDEEFNLRYNNKWSASQQLEHINLCLKPLIKIYSYPKIIIRIIFGKTNRNSKPYDLFIAKYEERVAKGTNPPGRFLPKGINIEREAQVKGLTYSLNKLCNQVSGFTERQLDKLIMPHPMFGKVTMREMLYFTIHHVKHHEEITKRNLRKEENPV